jgi:hypothetical protein
MFAWMVGVSLALLLLLIWSALYRKGLWSGSAQKPERPGK